MTRIRQAQNMQDIAALISGPPVRDLDAENNPPAADDNPESTEDLERREQVRNIFNGQRVVIDQIHNPIV